MPITAAHLELRVESLPIHHCYAAAVSYPRGGASVPQRAVAIAPTHVVDVLLDRVHTLRWTSHTRWNSVTLAAVTAKVTVSRIPAAVAKTLNTPAATQQTAPRSSDTHQPVQ